MSKNRTSRGGGFVPLFALMLILWVIVKLIWWILGAAALVGLYFLVCAVAREAHKRADRRAAHWAAIAARADRQHNWVLQGDDRGIYGTVGAELMHYLRREEVRRPNRRR